MTRLYRSAASDLATVRSAAPEPALVTRLSMLLAGSRVWLTGARHIRSGDIGRMLTLSLPAALYRVRWWGVVTSLIVVVLAWVAGYYTLHHPDALNLVGDAQTRQTIADEEFASYYTEYDNTSFAATVFTNNALLAAQCIAFGVTGVYPLILLYNTVLQIGVAGAVMAEHDALDIFFQLLAPHGLLELSAVFMAAGAGLRVFWTLLVPGGRPRGEALSEVFRTLLLVAFGLAMTLFVSGLLEGYVTPSTMPWLAKVIIGALACAAFWVWVFVGGRSAMRRGFTGDDNKEFTAEVAPYAA